jgi:ubiquitin carboxyl-terminal hydrolase 47
MTPEFRKNVYAYVHNSKKLENKNSIPFQLQKLFVLLQTTKIKPISTKGLLKSFQWTEADAFEQHDVQEFCRKLFEAIEISNKKAHWITDLF